MRGEDAPRGVPPARKPGISHYRMKASGVGTCNFREAEHLAVLPERRQGSLRRNAG